MTKTILPFDAADHLTGEQAVADYKAAAFETGDAADVSHALATVARGQRRGNAGAQDGQGARHALIS
jgi:DNA-binding phage protein